VTVDQQASFYERDEMDRHFWRARWAVAGGGGGNAAAAGAATAAAAAAQEGRRHWLVRYRVSGRRLWYSWQYIDALRKMIKGKMLIKGFRSGRRQLRSSTARRDHRVKSRRALDGLRSSSLEVLPEIVAA